MYFLNSWIKVIIVELNFTDFFNRVLGKNLYMYHYMLNRGLLKDV